MAPVGRTDTGRDVIVPWSKVPAVRHDLPFLNHVGIIDVQIRQVGMQPSGDVVHARKSYRVVGVSQRPGGAEILGQHVFSGISVGVGITVGPE